MALDANNVKDSGVQSGPRKPSPYIGYGIKEIMITGAEIKTASTGTPKIVYQVESTPISFEGFVGANGASGQVGSVQTGWLKPGSAQEQEAFGQLITFCKKAGVATENAPVFQDGELQKALDYFLPLIKGKFVRVKLVAKYYMGKDKEGAPKEKYTLAFARYQFAEETSIPMKETKLRFDENSKYDIDKSELATETADSTTSNPGGTDDLPF